MVCVCVFVANRTSQDGKQLEFLLSNNETLWLSVDSFGKTWKRANKVTQCKRRDIHAHEKSAVCSRLNRPFRLVFFGGNVAS